MNEKALSITPPNSDFHRIKISLIARTLVSQYPGWKPSYFLQHFPYFIPTPIISQYLPCSMELIFNAALIKYALTLSLLFTPPIISRSLSLNRAIRKLFTSFPLSSHFLLQSIKGCQCLLFTHWINTLLLAQNSRPSKAKYLTTYLSILILDFPTLKFKLYMDQIIRALLHFGSWLCSASWELWQEIR